MRIGERTRCMVGGVIAIGLSPAVARIFAPGPMVVSRLWFHSRADDMARTDAQAGRSTVARTYFFIEQVLKPSMA
jgi:hypothetical protein